MMLTSPGWPVTNCRTLNEFTANVNLGFLKSMWHEYLSRKKICIVNLCSRNLYQVPLFMFNDPDDVYALLRRLKGQSMASHTRTRTIPELVEKGTVGVFNDSITWLIPIAPVEEGRFDMDCSGMRYLNVWWHGLGELLFNFWKEEGHKNE